MHKHLSAALRSIEKARGAAKIGRNSPDARRGERVRREMNQASGILQNIGHLTSMIDSDDTDMMSEEQHSERAAAEREERRQARLAAQKEKAEALAAAASMSDG